MWVCNKCGRDNDNNTNFCPQCGTPKNGTQAKTTRKNNGLSRGIAIALSLVVVLGAAGIWVWSHYASGTLGAAGNSGWTHIRDIAAGADYTLGLREDGTVIYAGNPDAINTENLASWKNIERIERQGNYYGYLIGYGKDGSIRLEPVGTNWQDASSNPWQESQLSSWTNVQALLLGDNWCLSLCKDGTVRWTTAPGADDLRNVLEALSSWNKITAMATDGSRRIAGLRQDGTIAFVEWETDFYGANETCTTWTNVETLGYSWVYGFYGIEKDGTMHAEYLDSDCRNVDSFYIASDSAFALRRDGTIASLASWTQGDPRIDEVTSWRGVVEVGFASSYIGRYVPTALLNDGTVKAVTTGYSGEEYGYWDVDGWTGVKKLYSSDEFTIGIRSDGTVLTTGGEFDTLPWLDELADWQDIASLSFGRGNGRADHIVGLKTDGTAVAAGNNDYGQCEVG